MSFVDQEVVLHFVWWDLFTPNPWLNSECMTHRALSNKLQPSSTQGSSQDQWATWDCKSLLVCKIAIPQLIETHSIFHSKVTGWFCCWVGVASPFWLYTSTGYIKLYKKRKLKQFTGPSLIIRQANADIWIAGCLAEQMEVVAIEFAAFNDLNAVQSCSIMFNQFRQPRTSYIIHLLRSELEPMQLKTVNSAILVSVSVTPEFHQKHFAKVLSPSVRLQALDRAGLQYPRCLPQQTKELVHDVRSFKIWPWQRNSWGNSKKFLRKHLDLEFTGDPKHPSTHP